MRQRCQLAPGRFAAAAHESLVGVGGDQADPAESSGDQVGEELVTGRAGLAGRDTHPEDFAMPVRVDAGGEHHHGVDHAAALADLHGQRVGSDEGERPSLCQATVAELLDVLIELSGHSTDLGLRQPVDAEGVDQFVHASGGDTGEVAIGDHRDQG